MHGLDFASLPAFVQGTTSSVALNLWQFLPCYSESKLTLTQRAKYTKLLFEDQRQPVLSSPSGQEHRGHSLFPHSGEFH